MKEVTEMQKRMKSSAKSKHGGKYTLIYRVVKPCFVSFKI